MNRPDKRKRIWAVGLFVLAMGLTCGFLSANKTNKVNATLAGWNASNIITDYVMTDYGSMNESQIQSFLKSKVNCNNTELWRRQSTKVTWNIKDGHFVCMADDRFNGETAAHIIWQAAQDYRINPKVLIVTLQKESSLITDSMPHSGQYRTAMGFGCPDTAACDAKYFGLKNQVRNAARFFRAYQDNASGWYKPYWTGNYKVHWHPDLNRCGGTVLNIQNRATASLYSYTPYQPNQAALNAGWGTGDTCSAYGNRNFYNYFTSWFGDTRKNIAKIKTDLPDDKYRLRYMNTTDRTIQPASLDEDIRVNMIVGTRKNNNYDCFQLKKVGNQIYSLYSCASGLAIDVSGGTAVDENPIWQFTQNGTDAQKWYIYDNEDGSYSIATIKNPSLVLTRDNNGNIVLTNYIRSDAQKYRFLQTTQPLADGVYDITSKLSSDKSLDIQGGNQSNGANVQIYAQNFTHAQSFRIKYNHQNGYYSVINVFSEKALDVISGKNKNRTNVQMYRYDNVPAQQWQLFRNTDGTISLISACSGKALDVYGAGTSNGTNVQIYEQNKTSAQRWNFIKTTQPIQDGNYYILDSSELFAIDITGADKKNGANVQLYAKNYSKAQQFNISYDNLTGLYRIANLNSGKSIDVAGAKMSSGANVQQWDNIKPGIAQMWRIIKNADNSIMFVSPCGGNAIDNTGGKLKDKNNIQTFTMNGSLAQRWRVVKY